MIDIYGLKTCDTCRKAVKWLTAEGMDHVFHDLRAEGVTQRQIGCWADAVGWEMLLNKASTTWRGLDAADKEDVDKTKALALMTAYPTLVKRPVFDLGEIVLVGFKPAQQDALQRACR